MKNSKNNPFLKEFQRQIVTPLATSEGLKGYKGQLYILWRNSPDFGPKFDKRKKLHKKFGRAAFTQAYYYLNFEQSQRRHNRAYKLFNLLDFTKDLILGVDLYARARVWHNAVPSYMGNFIPKEWKNSAFVAVHELIEPLDLTYYANDYNFKIREEHFLGSDEKLKNIFKRLILKEEAQNLKPIAV